MHESHADPRHRNLLRRNRRPPSSRKPATPRARGRSGRTSSRRRWRFIASGAASCRSSRRASTSATSAASSSARSTMRGAGWSDLGAVAVTQGPGLVGSLLVGVVVREGRRRRRGPAARRGASSGRPHRIARAAERRAAAAGGRARRLRRPHEPVSRRDAGALPAARAARATMRRARRTTRSRSCSASAIPAGRWSIGWRASGNDRAIALPTTRLTHADRNAPELKGDLDFSFSGLKTAVLRYVQRAGREAGPLSGARGRRRLRELSARRRHGAARSAVRRGAAASGEEHRGRRRRVGEQPAARRARGARRDAASCRSFCRALRSSTDNAAMIAAAGLRKLREGRLAPADLNADAGSRCRVLEVLGC